MDEEPRMKTSRKSKKAPCFLSCPINLYLQSIRQPWLKWDMGHWKLQELVRFFFFPLSPLNSNLSKPVYSIISGNSIGSGEFHKWKIRNGYWKL